MKHLVEALKNVKTIITHDACADGLASALILKDVIPDAELRFLQYGTDAHAQLEPDFGQLFCDLTPVRERAHDFVAAGAIVLDHHEKQEDIVALFGERGIYVNNKTDDETAVDRTASGAVLAYRARQVMLASPVPPVDVIEQARESEHDAPPIHSIERETRIAEFARIAGVYDTWRTEHEDWPRAHAQAEALLFYPRSYWLDRSDLFGEEFIVQLKIGSCVIDKSIERAEKHIREGLLFTTKWKTNVAVVSTTNTNDIAELLRKRNAGVDVLVGFRYYVDNDRAKLRLSARSVSDHPVLPFVSAFGGGGHERSAGVTITLGDSDMNPYKAIQQLYNRYEERL